MTTDDSGSGSDTPPEADDPNADGTEDADDGLFDTFGNGYMVKENGVTKLMPRTAKTELLYEYEHGELFEHGADAERVVLDEDAALSIMPTESEHVYVLWKGDGRAVRNPPSRTDDVLSAVLGIERTGESGRLADLYDELRHSQVRPERMNRVLAQYAPLPPASVVPDDTGWVIEGTFRLTWHTNIHLVNRDYDIDAFDLARRRRSSDEPELLTLEPDLPAETIDLPLAGEDGEERVTLDERDLSFLTKALWLVNYRENHPDDVFWTQIERHAQSGTAPHRD